MMIRSIYSWHLNEGDYVNIASHMSCYEFGDKSGVVIRVSSDCVWVRMTHSGLIRKFAIQNVTKIGF